MQCPKCGCEQPQADECRRCRVIISKYNAIQRRHADKKQNEIDQEFMIPKDGPLSTDYSVSYQVRWVLEIQVSANGSFDYHAEFPIEVAS